jgi:hypothetical protein
VRSAYADEEGPAVGRGAARGGHPQCSAGRSETRAAAHRRPSSQAGCRGFESRAPLQEDAHIHGRGPRQVGQSGACLQAFRFFGAEAGHRTASIRCHPRRRAHASASASPSRRLSRLGGRLLAKDPSGFGDGLGTPSIHLRTQPRSDAFQSVTLKSWRWTRASTAGDERVGLLGSCASSCGPFTIEATSWFTSWSSGECIGRSLSVGPLKRTGVPIRSS